MTITTPIVSVDDMRAWLNLTSHDDDAILASNVAAAIAAIESKIDKKLTEYFDSAEYANSVPADLILAIKMLAAHFYSFREPVISGDRVVTIPWNAIDLIEPYRSVIV
ncbi:Phage gp6-like head-tail connector protein [Beijerinckia sp. 28-YEA-48]|nr:Phage gp6-like head-tail connector protein [Beijerinckia sp. 28-YEA-48]